MAVNGNSLGTEKEIRHAIEKGSKLRTRTATYLVQRGANQLEVSIEAVLFTQIQDPLLWEITKIDSQIINNLKTLNSLAYRPNTTEEFLKVKHQVYNAYQHKESLAKEHQHPLLAEKYRILGLAYR